jgi:lysophospholipase L1-like esterase
MTITAHSSQNCSVRKYLCLLGTAFAIAAFTAPRPAAALNPHPKIVFIGDEVTKDWFPHNSVRDDATWINKGIAGETSGETLARFKRDVIDLHPDVVNILVGTNDVRRSNWVLCGGDKAIDTCDNVIAMSTMAKAANIQVMIGTIPPLGPGPRCPSLQEVADRITAFNAVVLGNYFDPRFGNSTVVIDYNALLVELTRPGATEDRQRYEPNLTDDGATPNRSGYYLMTEAAEQGIGLFELINPSSGLSITESPDVMYSGTTIQYNVALTPTGGFTGKVNVTVIGFPDGLTVAPLTVTTKPDGTASFSVTAPPGGTGQTGRMVIVISRGAFNVYVLPALAILP